MLEYYIHSKKIIYLKDFVGCHHFVREDSISLMGVDWAVMVIKSYDKYVKLLEGYDCDLNRIFEPKVPYVIFGAMSLGNKDEIKVIFSTLADFEKKINFTGKLPLVYQFINFFILRGNLNMAAYICLFIFMFRKSDLIINIYRKFFHSFFKKFF